jgi:lipopolysaccharide export system permease protein
MYTILNERYLKFELFNGYNYLEGASNEREMAGKRTPGKDESMSRSKFAKTQVVFDLSSFQLQTTDKKWFQGNRIMRNLKELNEDMDSLDTEVMDQRVNYYLTKPTYFNYYMRGDSLIFPPDVYARKIYRDSVSRIPYAEKEKIKQGENPIIERKTDSDSLRSSTAPGPPKRLTARDTATQVIPKSTVALPTPIRAGGSTVAEKSKSLLQTKKSVATVSSGKNTTSAYDGMTAAQADSMRLAKLDSVFSQPASRDAIQGAANAARQMMSQILNMNSTIDNYEKEFIVFEIQWHKILASSLACIAMFLIGAPLGAIIKKGGLGVPFLVSILFFIIYYVFTMQGEKLAKQGAVDTIIGVWMADFILFLIGLIFLRQARADARLFDSDFYLVVLEKVKRWNVERRIERLMPPDMSKK